MPSEEDFIRKLEEHGKEIKDLSERVLVKNDVWYLIDTHWFNAWNRYVGVNSEEGNIHTGSSQAHPGPINNSGLFVSDSVEEQLQLKENLVDNLDYALVPEEAWKKLKEKFGVEQEDHEIGRKVIESGMFCKTAKVEVYQLELNLMLAGYEEEPPTLATFSRVDTFAKLYKAAKYSLKVPTENPDNYRLYIRHDNDKYELIKLTVGSKQLQDVFYPKQSIVFDVKTEDGLWRVDENKIVHDSIAIGNNPIALPGPSTETVPVATVSGSMSSSGSSLVGSSKITVKNTVKALYRLVRNIFDTLIVFSLNPFDFQEFCHRWYLILRDFSLTAKGLRSGNSYGGYSAYTSGNSVGSTPGLCGLQNLGNTCFMNSGIQCLSQVIALTDYFVKKQHELEINEDNPLGMQGRLAKAYAEVIHQMWNGAHSYVIPRGLKLVVGQFAPTFSGYHQQDSQELMSFLLDGLHEDLNRIKQKPYIEIKESEGRDDKVVAAEAWEDYKKRNDSIVVDTFHGQLKSTLVCPVCSKVSIKFDPFCFLSLPLPFRKERQISITFVPLDPNKSWIRLKVNVPKQGTYGDIATGVENLLQVPSDQMLVAEVYQHRLHKIYRPEDSLTGFMDRDEIVVYQLEDVPDEKSPVVVAVIQRYEKMLGSSVFHSSTKQTFACPIAFRLAESELTVERLKQETKNRLGTHIANWPDEDAVWWAEDERDGEDSGVEENGYSVEKMDTSHNGAAEGSSFPDEENGPSGSGEPELFQLSSVNHYGSTTYENLNGSGSVVEKLRNRVDQGSVYLAADWHDVAYQKFYSPAFVENFEEHESMKMVRSKKVVDLSECLDLFTTTEKLGKDDLWYCPQCKDHKQASKKMDLWSVPEVLLIHLKRFSYTRWYRDKVDADVDFPIRGLDMGNWLLNETHGPAVYDLIAVSNHYGGLGGGHYTAYGLNKNGKWYDYDDSNVSSMREENIVTRAAYVLLYVRRRNLDPSVDRNIEMETSEGEEEE